MGIKLTKCTPVTDYGDFLSPVRNIRVFVDGLRLIVDIIPSEKGDSFIPKNDDDPVEKILNNSYEIVESGRFLRLDFDQIERLVVHEEFATDIYFDDEGLDYPMLPKGNGVWPLVLVEDSPWKEILEDYRGGDDDDVKHYRIFSMTTYVDILGFTPSAKWLEQ